MEVIASEFAAGFGTFQDVVRSALRLLFALFCGAVIGVERERVGKAAGLRTHVLVAVGSALFVVAPIEAGIDASGLSRVLQGLITGIGFLGAGAILKREKHNDIRGLTTAAGIWMTAAIGMTVGLGRFGMALVGTAIAYAILSVMRHLDVAGDDGG